MHTAFALLLSASLVRFLLRHPGEPRTPWIIALSLALAILYVLGSLRGLPAGSRLARLAAVVAVWAVLVVLAPSFAWCAVPLLYTGLRVLPPRPALALVGLLTALVVAAQLRLADRLDPTVLLAPPAIAAVATAVFEQMRRQAVRQRELIDTLLRTRRDLAATMRREGILTERQRLAMEIHDTLAQSLSSQRMLLQAADRLWDTDRAQARTHVRTAGTVADHGLTEARRFVHDLAPADLARADGLPEALGALAARTSGPELSVHCHIEGARDLPEDAQSALLRIAQGALANVREHAGATTAVLTLTFLEDRVLLDVADDGRGFDPALARPGEGPAPRGHGLPAMRARAGRLGGALTIESAPDRGTVVSVAVPLEGTR
ncbi:sensor histidine kinase [Streptomyces xiamenensis]|uniref:sensor histidine kinase n=1 Tax=Streptomyces xiamenensis TaxID=408015 RepID=UPI0036B537D9